MPMSSRLFKVLGLIVFLAGNTVQAAGVTGTVHDLTMYWATDEVCRACHTPHNAKVAVPLVEPRDVDRQLQPVPVAYFQRDR